MSKFRIIVFIASFVFVPLGSFWAILPPPARALRLLASSSSSLPITGLFCSSCPLPPELFACSPLLPLLSPASFSTPIWTTIFQSSNVCLFTAWNLVHHRQDALFSWRCVHYPRQPSHFVQRSPLSQIANKSTINKKTHLISGLHMRKVGFDILHILTPQLNA